MVCEVCGGAGGVRCFACGGNGTMALGPDEPAAMTPEELRRASKVRRSPPPFLSCTLFRAVHAPDGLLRDGIHGNPHA